MQLTQNCSNVYIVEFIKMNVFVHYVYLALYNRPHLNQLSEGFFPSAFLWDRLCHVSHTPSRCLRPGFYWTTSNYLRKYEKL